MANHKSAIKRARQSEEQRVRNRSRKTRMKNVVRGLEEVIAGKSPEKGRRGTEEGGLGDCENRLQRCYP